MVVVLTALLDRLLMVLDYLVLSRQHLFNTSSLLFLFVTLCVIMLLLLEDLHSHTVKKSILTYFDFELETLPSTRAQNERRRDPHALPNDMAMIQYDPYIQADLSHNHYI